MSFFRRAHRQRTRSTQRSRSAHRSICPVSPVLLHAAVPFLDYRLKVCLRAPDGPKGVREQQSGDTEEDSEY